MVEFLKEWRAVILIVLILLVIIALAAAVMLPYAEARKAVCYQSAQRFNPPATWRWNPWGWGDGCEFFFNGTWFPADMIQPALK